MKFPFVSRKRYDRLGDDLARASKGWMNEGFKAEKLEKTNKLLDEQREEWFVKYQKLIADCRIVMATNEDLTERNNNLADERIWLENRLGEALDALAALQKKYYKLDVNWSCLVLSNLDLCRKLASFQRQRAPNGKFTKTTKGK